MLNYRATRVQVHTSLLGYFPQLKDGVVKQLHALQGLGGIKLDCASARDCWQTADKCDLAF